MHTGRISTHGIREIAVTILLLLACVSEAHVASQWVQSQRRTYDFDADWLLLVGDPKNAEATIFDDSSWQKVTLPHAWNEDAAFKVSIEKLPTGIAWYRKHFTLPEGDAGKQVYLEFEGVRFAADVYVNGKHVIRHDNGVMAFGLDLTDLVTPGENIVAVRTDNAWNVRGKATNTPYQWNDKNFYANYGGINKRTFLHVTDKLHQTLPLYRNLGTTGVYVYASDIDIVGQSATVTAESQVRNENSKSRTFTYEVIITDTAGKELKRFAADKPTPIAAGETTTVTASGRVDGLALWSWGFGKLYDVTTVLNVDGMPVDAVCTRTGFRKTEFADGFIRLNDRTIQVKGYAQRTTNEWPALGTNVPPWVSDFSNRLMVQSGGNLVRWMHVTPSKQDVESCDRVGLMQAMPAGDSERDAGGRRWEQRVELMRDAIIYNRNNPSVIFYEAGNAEVGESHMKQMVELKNQYDPHGGRAMGSREMLGSKTAEWGGEMLYINKSAAKPVWATEYSRDEALRRYIDEYTPPFHKDGVGTEHQSKPAPTYNRNQDSMAIETVRRWYDYWRERPGTGKRVNAGGVNIIFSDSNTHHRGAENYRRSGEVDPMRIPKEGFFAHQVMWNGWVDPETPAAHIVGHWNYAETTVKNVYVISNADKVELLLNGKSLGFGEQSYRFLFTFADVKFAPGTLTAVGYDAKGSKICSTEIVTAGAPAAIKLTPHVSPTGFQADGSDVALIDVEVVDTEDRRCPTAFNEITFALEGPAEWRGGIAQGPDNYILSRTLPVELGINRVIVRSTATAGSIVLKATSPDLAAASVQLQTSVVKVDGGLSPLGAQSELPANFSRGPTPTGDSVIPTRRPLTIVSATAGSDQEKAGASFDDNEDTTWSSTGRLGDAWIEYQLASTAKISEVTMRLASWRNRSYPIRILVDEHEVFAGPTPRSLGYVTIAFTPTSGQSVKIQLIGAPGDKDEFDMTEITGMKLKAGTADGAAGKGKLQIVEAEIYGPLQSPPPRGTN